MALWILSRTLLVGSFDPQKPVPDMTYNVFGGTLIPAQPDPCLGQPGWAGSRNKHSPTHTYCDHQSSLTCFLHLLWSMASSLFNLRASSLFPQSLSKFSFIYLLVWHPPLHTPYISTSNHCLIFAAHAYTIATCFAVVPRLCHLNLVSLSTLYLELLYLTPHIHLTILISAHWSATSVSFLTGQVSLLCNILLHTQLLYNLPLNINDISLLVSNGTNCLNLFHPIQILVSTAASASLSILNMSPK